MTPAESFEAGDWREWSRHVLKELERLDDNDKQFGFKLDELREKLTKLINDKIEILGDKLDKLDTRMTMLQMKVAGIAAISSILTTLIFLLLSQILRGK